MIIICPQCHSRSVSVTPDPDLDDIRSNDQVILSCPCGYWTSLARSTVDTWLTQAA